jgi:hypothetical protein
MPQVPYEEERILLLGISILKEGEKTLAIKPLSQ